MVSLEGGRAWRKSKNISGLRPNNPSKLDLCRSGHLSYDMAELTEIAIGVEKGCEINLTLATVGTEDGSMS